ncbi:MAG TPA: hypothetical protein VGP93_11205, partial [Polyangiaceae bacterium]|nr:hypothetical protein [Polyangiaceae bacterium]
MLRARWSLREQCLRALCLALFGCGSHSAPVATAIAADLPPRALAAIEVGPPRLVPPDAGPAVLTFDTASDGSRYLISAGLRMLAHPDGSLELAPDFFPGEFRSVNALALPERLGSGFLYHSHASGRTSLWKAPSWTARLVPLAELDGEVTRVVAGLDRLYVQRDRRTPWIGIDAGNGSVLDLGGLPPAPNYGAMAFADEWFGVVEVPYRGLLATFDAGTSYRPVGVSATKLLVREGEISVEGPNGAFALGTDGVLRPLAAARPAAPGGRAGKETQNQKLPLGPLGARPLELAVLHGYPVSADEAWVAAGGALGRVRLSDGAVRGLRERAYAGSATCHGLSVGAGAGFLCGEPRGKTVIYAVTPTFGLAPLLSFDEPRFVASNGSGALSIRGACGRQQGAAGTYCIVPPRAPPYELVVEGDLGVERVVALDDGRAALLIPPRLGAAGSLALIEPAGHEHRVALKFPKTSDPVQSALLKRGLWLD